MTRTYNIDEIFEMAEQIERNGAAFYRRAAKGSMDEERKQKLLDLAEMELSHEKIFSAMRTEQENAPTPFDPDGETARYLDAIANGRVFDLQADLIEDLAGKTIEEILKIAIDLEKDSIVFYLGLRDLVSESLGKERMETIIAEEMGHITLLSDELAALSR
ncbi:MAG: ferritin family protein [Candidatus Bipolaricaulota bacterium]|nr:ferritin family protein [Candidatus Bipolaricaulota bacterium]